MPARQPRALTGAQAAMQPGLVTRTTALGVAALMIASALGYWGISAYRKGQLQKAVTALVKDSSERLQAALAVETEAVHEDAARMVGKLDDQAQEVDKHVIELRGMSASPNRALVDEALAANARKRALATSRRVADDVERARQLAAVR